MCHINPGNGSKLFDKDLQFNKGTMEICFTLNIFVVIEYGDYYWYETPQTNTKLLRSFICYHLLKFAPHHSWAQSKRLTKTYDLTKDMITTCTNQIIVYTCFCEVYLLLHTLFWIVRIVVPYGINWYIYTYILDIYQSIPNKNQKKNSTLHKIECVG